MRTELIGTALTLAILAGADRVEAGSPNKQPATDEIGSPVKSVKVVKTGVGEGHWEHIYGSRKPALWWIFFGKRLVTLPLNVFVIEHQDGLVLFDAGQDRAVITDPDYYPKGLTGVFMRNLFRFHIEPDETLTRQLELAGYSASDISRAVFSHFHLDHVGGIKEILQADLYATQTEWDLLSGPHPERDAMFTDKIILPGAKWHQITFSPTEDPALAPFTEAYDLMGDGSIILLPTPGHTPGSLSMLVKRDNDPPVLLIGDLTYNLELLEKGQVADTGEKEQLLEVFAKVLALRENIPGLIIIAGHDGRAAERLNQNATIDH